MNTKMRAVRVNDSDYDFIIKRYGSFTKFVRTAIEKERQWEMELK